MEGFEMDGVWIENPYMSECGRFEVNPKEYYNERPTMHTQLWWGIYRIRDTPTGLEMDRWSSDTYRTYEAAMTALRLTRNLPGTYAVHGVKP